MHQKQLRRTAVRTLRAGIIRKHPPGEKRDHLLALVEVLAERSRLIDARNSQTATTMCEKA
jgi:hypothetical protein